jgi:hypothetical protein
MRAPYLRVSVLWASLACGGIIVHHHSPISNNQTKPKKHNNLDKVPKPKDAEIRRIQTAKEWPNPYIIIYSDGFELVLGHGGDSIKRAHLLEIEEVLLSLPLRRWPLGRVVAVTESGLRNPGENFDDVREGVQRMLEARKVRVELWPSG